MGLSKLSIGLKRIADDMRRINYKNILFLIIILVSFFGSLEIIQRCRYAIRNRDFSWLVYGTNLFYRIHDQNRISKAADKTLISKLKTKPVVSNSGNINVFHFEYDTKHDADGNLLYKKNMPGDYILTENATMHINSHGFRGAEIESPKTKTRICMLGGSSTLGAYNNDDKTYPYYTETILKEKYGKDTEVINCGVGGSTINENYYMLREEILFLNPDIITVYAGYNSWNSRSREGLGWRSALFNLKVFINDHSLFFCTLTEKYYIVNKRAVDEAWYNPGVASLILRDQKIWLNFRLYLERICELAKDHNIKVILITQPLCLVSKKPRSFWENRTIWKRHYGLTTDIVKEVAAKYNIECLNLANIIDNTCDDEKRKKLFSDVVHLTDDGNYFLARIISWEINAVLEK